MFLASVQLRYLTPDGREESLRGASSPAGRWLRLEVVAPDAAGRVLPPPSGLPAREVLLRVAQAEPGLRLLGLTIELDGVNLRDRFLANGFQSWSQTRLLGPDDRLPGLRLLRFLRPYGDYSWVNYDGRPGRFHSHWLTYTVDTAGACPSSHGSADPLGRGAGPAGRQAGRFTFLASLNEANAYTVFHVDYRAPALRRGASCGRLWAEIDVEGLQPRPGDTLAHLYSAEGDALLPLVRTYAARLAEITAAELGPVAYGPRPGALIPRPAAGAGPQPHRPGGWNSWYNYYTRVTAKDILAETEALRSEGLPLDFVQIDDGWQVAVGDWLGPSARFAGDRERRRPRPAAGPVSPDLMPGLAASIRDSGFVPGLWVAPFVAVRQSTVFRRGWVHPWTAGWNPLWGSSIHALDLSRPEVQDYVREVGDTFRQWGFGLVKADFLYAAALRPWGGRTRAQRMREAMRLLREVMPGRLLACGVPLASAAGLCDFNRLGPDTAPKWEDSLLAFCRYRERVSNLNALRTLLGRWFMNGTLFVLDPDVFILGRSKLSPAERRTLYDVTTTLGGMQSFSDSIARLDLPARDLIRRTFPLPDLSVLSVTEEQPDVYTVVVDRKSTPDQSLPPAGSPADSPGLSRLMVNLSTQGGLPTRSSEWE
jgi:hypothetical protein